MIKEILEKLSNNLIDDIKNAAPVFLLIIGGSASGKNYVYEQYFSEIPLVDVDSITKELANGDLGLARKFVSKAVAMANKELQKYFENKESVAQVSTGAGAKAVFNKLKKAKDNGMNTALILVDTDIKKAIERNKQRAASGKQGLIPDWKVEKSNLAARDSFNQNAKYADFSGVIENNR